MIFPLWLRSVSVLWVLMFEELNYESWAVIGALLPKQSGPGRSRADDRSTLNAILYVLTTGCRWDDLQKTQYDHCYTTAWRRLRSWEEQGVLKSVLERTGTRRVS
jgi:transposase